jgi:glycosyltransferase involved in cell wall biosynthesis
VESQTTPVTRTPEAVHPFPSISVLVPVFNSDQTLVRLVEETEAALEKYDYEVIFIDDGSRGVTWERILDLARAKPQIRALRLGRNSGQQAALLAGIRVATKEVCVTIDDDLQYRPSDLPTLVDRLRSGFDCVYGYPLVTKQPIWRRIGSLLTRGLLYRAVEPQDPSRTSPFRAFRTSLRNAFPGDLGPLISVDSLLSWGTERFDYVPVSHYPRTEGRSGYSIRRLIRAAVETTTAYSVWPLRVVALLGFVAVIMSLGLICWVISMRVMTENPVPGFAFLASLVGLTAGAQLIGLGIIGEYLAQIHLRSMRKPSYLIVESWER